MNKTELLQKIWQDYQREKATAKEANKKATELLKTFEKILYSQDTQLFENIIKTNDLNQQLYEHQT